MEPEYPSGILVDALSLYSNQLSLISPEYGRGFQFTMLNY